MCVRIRRPVVQTPECIPGPLTTIVGSSTNKLHRELLTNPHHVQPNEFGSDLPFEITNDGCKNFEISTSALDNVLGEGPLAYPSIYKGCHWGTFTVNSGLPLRVAQVRNPGSSRPLRRPRWAPPGH